MKNWIKNNYNGLNLRYASHMKILRYLISGGTAAVTDLLALYILTDVFDIWYVISTPIAFLIAFGVSFYLQKNWTFQDRTSNAGKQGALYFVVSVINLFINSSLVYLFTDVFGSHYLVSQFIAAGIMAVISFFIYQKLIFNRPQTI